VSRRARVLAAAVILSAGLPARAFVRNEACEGAPLFWGGEPPAVRVEVNASGFVHGCASGQAVLDAVRAAFPAWSPACSALAFDVAAVQTSATDVGWDPAGPNVNLVVFRSGRCSDPARVPADAPCRSGGGARTCADEHGCWDDQRYGSEIVALTTTTYDAATGRILDADLELRGWDGTFAGAPLSVSLHGVLGDYFTCGEEAGVCASYGEAGCRARDVRAVTTHEAGHMLGLAHSPVATATMFATTQLGDLGPRDLDADDVAGVCAIYPSSAPTSVGARCGQDESPGGCGQAGSGLGAAGAVLAVAGLRRARRRRA
jgi:hypothetical protein